MTVTARGRLRLGFRFRVLGAFVALLAAAIVVGLLLQRAVLLRELDREVDEALEREYVELRMLAGGHNPATGAPFGSDVRAIFDTFLRTNVAAEGEVFLAFLDGAPYATTPAPLRLDRVAELAQRWGSLTHGDRGQVMTAAGPVRFVAAPLNHDGATRGVFVIGQFMRSARQAVESNFRIEAAVSAGVLVVATIIAWFLAGRLLRPVRELTATAEAISDDDLTRRIPVEGDDEISRLAATFNQMLDRLEGAFTAQRTFIDDAGHELRTPITVVRGHLELMGDDREERLETMALVDDELDRMARIVDDLLLLAKSEQPDFVQPKPVEVTDLTTGLLAKARTLGDRDWQLDASADGMVEVDPQRVTQAVLNLARNALEHTASGAEIGLGSEWGNDGLRLWVRDTGSGVEPADRDRIFERFARGGTGRRSGGAGLGLAIVRSVAAAHGGSVDLASVLGQGSTFTLVLPASEQGG